jgi:hypothetical protein
MLFCSWEQKLYPRRLQYSKDHCHIKGYIPFLIREYARGIFTKITVRSLGAQTQNVDCVEAYCVGRKDFTVLCSVTKNCSQYKNLFRFKGQS